MANNKDIAFEWATIYIATNYDSTSNNLPAITSSNKATIITEIEADYTFAPVWYVRDVNVFIDPTVNASTIQADDCGVWDIAQYAKYESRLEFEWLAVDDVVNLWRMLWLTVELDWTDQIIWFDVQAKQVPYLLMKVVSCANEAGETTTTYLVKVFVDSDIQKLFHNFARDGVNDITWASMVLRTANGWKFIVKDEKQTNI